MPVSAALAVYSGRVVQAFQANSRSLIARAIIVHVYVSVALTWQAFAVGSSRIAVESGRTSLTKLSSIAGLAVAVVDFVRVVVEHAAVGEYVRVGWSWTRTQTAFSDSVAVVDLMVAGFA